MEELVPFNTTTNAASSRPDSAFYSLRHPLAALGEVQSLKPDTKTNKKHTQRHRQGCRQGQRREETQKEHNQGYREEREPFLLRQ